MSLDVATGAGDCAEPGPGAHVPPQPVGQGHQAGQQAGANRRGQLPAHDAEQPDHAKRWRRAVRDNEGARRRRRLPEVVDGLRERVHDARQWREDGRGGRGREYLDNNCEFVTQLVDQWE